MGFARDLASKMGQKDEIKPLYYIKLRIRASLDIFGSNESQDLLAAKQIIESTYIFPSQSDNWFSFVRFVNSWICGFVYSVNRQYVRPLPAPECKSWWIYFCSSFYSNFFTWSFQNKNFTFNENRKMLITNLFNLRFLMKIWVGST